VEPLDGGFQLLAAILDDLPRGRIHDHFRGNAQSDVLESGVSHVLRLGSGNIAGETLRGIVPGKAEPAADVGTRRQALRAAAGHVADAFRDGGKGGCDRQAAGSHAGQAQEVTSGDPGGVGHKGKSF
jgi:hypothetical protein